MSSALALSSRFESRWEILSGPMKGAGRVMTSAQFTIGRSPECEFLIVNDPKCSRRHATIALTNDGCEVRSLNERNLVQVNGRDSEYAKINDGDILTIGDTEIKFHATPAAAPSDGGLELDMPGPAMAAPQMSIAPMPSYQSPSPYSAPPRPAPQRRNKPKPKSGPRKWIILAVVGALIWWLASPTKKKPEAGLRTEQQEQADIDTANKMREAGEAENLRRVDNSVNARQAQENYVRGFRDYRKGQYERSQVSFQACLALNPEHVLCNRYIRLSQRKFNELVQYQIVLGRKYRDQNQYKACRSAFRNVMAMVKDANSKIYQEAKANYDACNAYVEGRY